MLPSARGTSVNSLQSSERNLMLFGGSAAGRLFSGPCRRLRVCTAGRANSEGGTV